MKVLLVFVVFLSGVICEPQRNFGRSSCGGRKRPNYSFKGTNYLVSWRLGCSSFTNSQAENFCRQSSMRAISLDNEAKAGEFFGLVAREGQKYFWTGGRVNHGRSPSITWPSGSTTTTRRWSDTGRLNLPQPDNREGNEFCVAVLNNFYNDGVKFHDVACSHRKPVICQP